MLTFVESVEWWTKGKNSGTLDTGIARPFVREGNNDDNNNNTYLLPA